MKDRKSAEVKHIKVPFSIIETKETKENGTKYFTFKGYGSTFGNLDRVDDVVVRGAFLDSLKEFMPMLLWQHNWGEPIGIFVSCYEDDKGLYVEGKMPLDDDFVRGRVVPQMKIGSVKSMSIGYSIEKYNYDENSGICYLQKLTLWEISLVTIPANPEAMITDMKSVVPYQNLPLADREREWDKSSALGRVRSFTDSEDSPSSKYKKAFLWYDKESDDKFGSYKLPIADVIDGKLVAVPRAIFAAAGAMSGARGGVNIPDSEKKGVITNINKYYAKMRSEFNDEDIVSPFEKSLEDITNLREIDNYLKTCGLSTKKCNIIISKIKKFVREGQTGYEKDQEASLRDAGLNEFFERIKKLGSEVSSNERRT
jgi:HK97 family phage prohead protease